MIGKRRFWPIAVTALAVASASWADQAVRPELVQAKQRLTAAQAAERQAGEELAMLRASGRASAQEISEFEAFLDGLRRMVAAQRRELDRILSGEPAQDGLPNRAASSLSPIDDAPIPTDEERMSTLDRDLDASLGEFDQMLLREQEKLAAKTRSASATGAAGGADGEGDGEGDGASGSESAGGGERGEGEQTAATTFPNERGSGNGEMRPLPPADSAGQGEPGDARVATGPSAEERRGARGGAGLPPDIPDGKDDDVVARQLREAAENEPDPVLREKLWDEYRKYKNASR